jgi:hypothetical protein
MTYELVLQWPASSIDDYDAMIEMEEALIEKLTDHSEVDGHDSGSGEMNIFILTTEPMRAFEEVKSVLCHHDLWPKVRAAYRHPEATEYTVIWPRGLRKFEII